MALKRLDWNSHYHVAAGSTDVRGWHVVDMDHNAVGKVDGLLFDPVAKLVRYAIVAVTDHRVLVPIGQLEIDEAARQVITHAHGHDALLALPTYDEASFDEADHYAGVNPTWQRDDQPDYALEPFANAPQPIRAIEQGLRSPARQLTFTGSEPVEMELPLINPHEKAWRPGE
ncbi:MAG: hypothetical protein JWM80_3557 [Cyanobacteria bacterium RYN_339]|nr:hypothetical protein [Cyanobacteria bacterium RYN_339]